MDYLIRKTVHSSQNIPRHSAMTSPFSLKKITFMTVKKSCWKVSIHSLQLWITKGSAQQHLQKWQKRHDMSKRKWSSIWLFRLFLHRNSFLQFNVTGWFKDLVMGKKTCKSRFSSKKCHNDLKKMRQSQFSRVQTGWCWRCTGLKKW